MRSISSFRKFKMEVLSPVQAVIPKTTTTNGCNGLCKEELHLEDVERFDIHTGNMSHWSSLKRRTTQNPATELHGSLIKALNLADSQKCCIKESYKGKQKIVCKNAANIEKVTETDRALMKVTAKVFAHQIDHHQLKEAILESLDELGIINFDVVFLAFPQLPEDSELSFTEVAKPFWREMEKMKDDGLVSHLACCDLDAGKLKELLSWARIKPEVNQVNLTSCCHMPQNLVEFAKQEEILLHTHGDPPTLLPDDNVESVMGSYAEDNIQGWSTRWVVRYSIVVKCRGVIKNKGYIASLYRPPGASDTNGNSANGNDIDH
eukprot:Seg1960.7 transcript_id=Seg1960.7/GoldUCD/mRNA.D3Y31 product="Glutamate-cysteine ligase regulatory subunit" protein_id=Seg1960.7/GoldUCD/D3Y31